MKQKVIKAEEIHDYEGKSCPQCHEGVMVLKPDHDAMIGNSTKLECSVKDQACGFTIDIVSD